jgi:hypothetical protein
MGPLTRKGALLFNTARHRLPFLIFGHKRVPHHLDACARIFKSNDPSSHSQGDEIGWPVHRHINAQAFVVKVTA